MFFAETPLCRDYRRFDLLSRTESALDSHSGRAFVLKQKARDRGREKERTRNSATSWCRMTLLLRSISGLYGTEYNLQATKRGYFPPQKHQKHMPCWQYFRKHGALYYCERGVRFHARAKTYLDIFRPLKSFVIRIPFIITC